MWLQVEEKEMPKIVKLLLKLLHLLILFLPALIFVGYLVFPTLRSLIDILVSYVDWRIGQVVVSQNITSILEVAFGLNIALSFLGSFSALITNLFHKSVEEFESSNNPSFLEAMNEAADEAGSALGAKAIDVALVKGKFEAHIQAQIADFKSDASNSESLMRLLGNVNAFACFVALVAVAIVPTQELPLLVFCDLIFSVSLPILMHLGTLAVQYCQYKYAIENGLRNGNPALQGFITSVFVLYKNKKKQAKSIKIPKIEG